MKEKKLSLAPLKFAEAVGDLLRVKPPPKTDRVIIKAKKAPAKKKAAKKR